MSRAYLQVLAEGYQKLGESLLFISSRGKIDKIGMVQVLLRRERHVCGGSKQSLKSRMR